MQSLAGVRVLVTRSETEGHVLAEKLRAQGATTVELPTIAIIPPENNEFLDQPIKDLSTYDWLVFTSQHGVRFFAERMNALGVSTGRLNDLKVAAIGPATAAALEKLGRKPDYVPDEFLSEQILNGLGDLKGKRILLPRANIAGRNLPEELTRQGANVEEVIAYRTIIPEDLSLGRLQSTLKGRVDVVTFTSPSTVRNLAQVAGNKLGSMLSDVKVACIGPVTATAANTLGVHVNIVARNHTIDDLVEAIVNEIGTV